MVRTDRLVLRPSATGWQILDRYDGPVGAITYVGREDDALLLGYEIANEHRNQGYATEALRAVLDQATVRVIAETDADHTASRRVMEKAGMVLQGLDDRTVRYAYDVRSAS